MKDQPKQRTATTDGESIHRHHRANTPTANPSRHQWHGTRFDALSSKKLWSILRQLSHNPDAPNPEAEAAIISELLARGSYSLRSQWRAPH